MSAVRGSELIKISSTQFERIAHERLLLRLGGMLRACAAVGPEIDPLELRQRLERVLEQAAAQGIRTERLLGMYALICLSDQVDPLANAAYAAVLRSTLAEDDKAHLLHMLRCGEIKPGQGGLA